MLGDCRFFWKQNAEDRNSNDEGMTKLKARSTSGDNRLRRSRFIAKVARMKKISRNSVYWKLVLAAQARVGITLASVVLIFIVAAPFAQAIPPWLVIVALFGIPLVVSWIVTKSLCERIVKCPHCGGSLWQIGTGNFKPRRMKIKDSVTRCPHCEALLV